MLTFRISSTLGTSCDAVWEEISTPAGINREFAPWLRMTFPQALEQLSPQTVPLGERLCRSWILLFGVLPFDYDDVTLVEVIPGRGFREASSMLTQRVWEHDRSLEPLAGGSCRVTDEVRFEARLAFMTPWVAKIVGATFRLRHRNLRRRFGP